LGVSSEDVTTTTPASPEDNKQIITTAASKMQGTTSTSNPGNPTPTSTISSTSSRPSTTTPAAASSATQQKTSPPASLGSSAATTAARPVPIHPSSPPATPGGLGTAVASPPSVVAQGSQPSDQLASTKASIQVSTSSLPPGVKGYGVSSPTSVAKQPHSSPSSSVQGLASSTRPGSVKTSVTPFDGSVSPTTSKASLPPGSINKVSEAATTTPTVEADQRSHGSKPVSTKPASADQHPTSTHPSAPVPGDQTASSSPGQHHLNTSFQNEVICKDQVQNNWPTMYLKEARTCTQQRMLQREGKVWVVGAGKSKAFPSQGTHCLASHFSVHGGLLHIGSVQARPFPLDPEKVLEELKEKDKLEELGIANITSDKTDREMIINDEFSTPLIITIVTLAGSLLLIAAIYGCCHQRFSQKKDQQRLTEELQTMENGYHDNPTLEVMETSSEMQEKKVNLNGELGDSWIVPLDTLMKEDLEEEEDTHL
ncbi:Podocalyxin, partial [Pterocles gutturalis]